MKCSQCQTENPDARNFCCDCGAELLKICSGCGYANLPRNKFCNECGHNLILPSRAIPQVPSFDEKLEKIQRYLPEGLTEKILAQRGKIEGERKQVTVMFCDMVGFTSLSEKLGPEDAYSIIDQVLEILIRKAHDYEGTVNKMTGDGIMALFGAPIALEDGPQRALRSALAIHREMARFNYKTNQEKKEIPPIRMRIGIHTGPVVVGTIGNNLRVEFTAVGDTVNLASRMEGLAESGTTYVTEETFRLTEGLFEFEAIGKKIVKGKKEAIPVYKVLSGKEDMYLPRPGSERMIYSGMVGRDSELDRLELHVMKAINGEGSIANIIGEAGIGKSRLVAELKKREAMKRVTLLEGRALSIGKNLSFHPIIDIFKQWARIRVDDGEVTAFGKLETAVRSLYPEEVGEVLPFVATLMGMKLSGRYAERVNGIEGEALEKLILKNVKDLLSKASEKRPLIIVAEDLHWADASSIELMESLFRLAETQRILFVNVFRPGYKETGDRIAATIKERFPVYYVEMVLEPLDERMSEALITNILNISGLHQTVIGQIVQRASGNPFFIEEVVRSFIDEGAVVLKDGTFQVTEKIGTIAIPNTINDVLMARIDRLEEMTRNLVRIASVIGRNFFYKILAGVAGSVEDIDCRLLYLTQIQLINERRRLDEVEYLFKHTLAQEAAYESILHQKRKEIHLNVARLIEKVFSDKLREFYGMLAYHYTKGGDRQKTEEYLIKAGEEALKTSASSEALQYFKDALVLYGETADPAKEASLKKNIAFALFNKGRYEEAVEYFESVLKHYGEKVSKDKLIKEIHYLLFCLLGAVARMYIPYFRFKKIATEKEKDILWLRFFYARALGVINPRKFFSESIYILKKIIKYDVSGIEFGAALCSGAIVSFSWSGISFTLSRKILEICKEQIPLDDPKSMLFYKMCEIAYNCVAGDCAIDNYNEKLIDQNLYVGEIYPAALYIFHHGHRALLAGQFEEAQKMINKLSEISDVYENNFARTIKYELKIKMLIKYRQVTDALKEIEAGIDFVTKLEKYLYVHQFYSMKAHLQVMLGDIQGADAALSEAKEYAKKPEVEKSPYCYNNYLSSKFIYDIYHLEEAVKNGNKQKFFEYRQKAAKSGKKALKNARKVACDLTQALNLMAIYCWLINKQKKALKWWGKGIEAGENLDARVELSRTYYEIGKRLSEPKSRHSELGGKKANEFLTMAGSLFEELGLQKDIEELDQTLNERK